MNENNNIKNKNDCVNVSKSDLLLILEQVEKTNSLVKYLLEKYIYSKVEWDLPRNADALNTLIEHVKNTIYEYLNVDKKLTESKSRKYKFKEARQIVATIIYLNTKLDYREVGKLTYKQNHATIINSVKVVKNLIDTEIGFNSKFKSICKRLNINFNDIYLKFPCNRKNNNI